ncbi:MAG: alpha/beta fold hydrolase [Salinarimonas sp.]|nr:alpha/beta fold hydrolase [Salinarimonas sp.]
MITTLLAIAAILIAVAIALPFVMVLWPWNAAPDPLEGLEFDVVNHMQAEPLSTETQAMRDGYPMVLRRLDGPEGGPLVVMIHGSAWNGMPLESLGRRVAQYADVLIPDLRGHGAAPGRRGDVDYIGQLEDDLADLISAQAEPGQEVILLGYSSGGGLVVRFAGGPHGDLMDRAVLIAPFLQHDAPTTRTESGGWALPNVKRIIGLTLLDAAGIRAFNSYPVLRFAMPKAVLEGRYGHMATPEYSFRLNASFAPRRDWKADITHLPPFLLIAGTNDEAFHSEAYEPTMTPLNANGTYRMVPDKTHLEIPDAPETAEAVVGFVRG